jgi:hypothetical protein
MSMDLAVELALALQQQQGEGGGGGDEDGAGDAAGVEGANQERIHTISIRSPEGLPAEVAFFFFICCITCQSLSSLCTNIGFY